jgi:pyruvate formate lyase activating enzyme
MKIGGLQKTSLIEYPEKISCIIFLSGCNFRCPYCQNPELVTGEIQSFVSESYLFDFLKKRKGFLDAVSVTGGEPLFQKGLKNFLFKIKQEGYLVKLDTNGSFSEELQNIIDANIIDYIAMDIKTDPFSYYPVICDDNNISEKIFKSIQLIINSGVSYEFRTTCIKNIINEKSIETISKLIAGAKLYALQKFNDAKILSPEFFKNQNPAYSDKKILNFKNIAEKYVKKCILRG